MCRRCEKPELTCINWKVTNPAQLMILHTSYIYIPSTSKHPTLPSHDPTRPFATHHLNAAVIGVVNPWLGKAIRRLAEQRAEKSDALSRLVFYRLKWIQVDGPKSGLDKFGFWSFTERMTHLLKNVLLHHVPNMVPSWFYWNRESFSLHDLQLSLVAVNWQFSSSSLHQPPGVAKCNATF